MPTLRSAPTGLAVPPPNSHLNYYGGKVISSVQAEVIFWGAGVDATTTSQIAGYFQAVPNSSYIDWLSEYNTSITAQDGGAGSNQTIGRGGLNAAPVTITPTLATGTSLTDTQIQQELTAQINAGNLPQPNANLLYVAYFAPGVTITQGGGTSCNAFCGYHQAYQPAAAEIFYSVIPDVATCAGACDFVPGDAFASITAITSHEVVEAITDAENGMPPGTVGRPLAWYDPAANHGEIGDLCLALVDTVAGYSVQKEWSNAQGACVVGGASGGKSGNGCGCELVRSSPAPDSLAACLGLAGLVALLLRRRRVV